MARIFITRICLFTFKWFISKFWAQWFNRICPCLSETEISLIIPYEAIQSTLESLNFLLQCQWYVQNKILNLPKTRIHSELFSKVMPGCYHLSIELKFSSCLSMASLCIQFVLPSVFEFFGLSNSMLKNWNFTNSSAKFSSSALFREASKCQLCHLSTNKGAHHNFIQEHKHSLYCY